MGKKKSARRTRAGVWRRGFRNQPHRGVAGADEIHGEKKRRSTAEERRRLGPAEDPRGSVGFRFRSRRREWRAAGAEGRGGRVAPAARTRLSSSFNSVVGVARRSPGPRRAPCFWRVGSADSWGRRVSGRLESEVCDHPLTGTQREECATRAGW